MWHVPTPQSGGCQISLIHKGLKYQSDLFLDLIQDKQKLGDCGPITVKGFVTQDWNLPIDF